MAELPTQRDFEDYGAWTGRDVLGPDGERLGAVELIFLDEATDRPEWVLVKLDDGGDTAFVPLAGAGVEERSIRVEHDRGQVAAAPRPDADETLSVDQERRLYEHYGLAYSQQESSTVLPEGAAADAQPTEARPRLRRFASTRGQATEQRPTEAAAAEQSPTAKPDAEPRPTEQRATPEPPAPEPDQTPAPAAEEAPETKGTGVTQPRSSASPPPTPIPPPAPTVLPPEGGFQGAEDDDGGDGGPLGFLKRRPALPVALAGAIAGLIAVLALRRRR